MRTLKNIAHRTGLRRTHLASARLCCERNILMVTARTSERRSRILCYHSIGTPQWGVNDVSPSRFRGHIVTALKEGYRFVPPELIAAGGGGPNDLALTFDDGLMSVATNAAPILAEFGVPWTLFVVSDWADGTHPFGDGVMLGWGQIEHLAQRGVTIGSHSVTHPRFRHLTSDATLYELGESRRRIAARIGITPSQFAIPMGTSGDWDAAAMACARTVGYDIVYAQSESRRSRGTVARTFITRFDGDRIFRKALAGAYDRWEEWV